jgi:protein ImuB
VARLACVDLPAFPLQLLGRRHPEWASGEDPVVVVAEDRPQAPILWCDARARRHGVLPGLRYAQGLSLAAGLRAGVVSAGEIETARAEVVTLCRRFTPGVEPGDPGREAGSFWLDPEGLARLEPSLERWARAIQEALAAIALQARVVVGFSHFGSYALARSLSSKKPRVLASPEEERRLLARVPLAELEIAPRLREALDRLGVRQVGELTALPAGGLLERFGREAHRLHQLAADAIWAPLLPEPEERPPREALELDDPETDRERLLFLLKRRLDRLLGALADRGEALVELVLELRLDSAQEEAQPRRARSGATNDTCGARIERLRPAAPTLDGRQLLELVRLRLEARPLESAVRGFGLEAEAVRAAAEQLQLFAARPRRDLAAGDRALARLRAELGEAAVVRAELRAEHLPEDRFRWQPLLALPDRGAAQRVAGTSGPAPRAGQLGQLGLLGVEATRAEGERPRRLVRRLLAPEPIAQPDLDEREPDLYSGRWWSEHPVERAYHFLEDARGELSWVYHDPAARRWFRQGRVE